MSFQQFKHIIENIYGNKNSSQMLTDYRINANEMLSTLEQIHPGLTSVIAKNNITRIMNKIFNSLKTINNLEMFSDNQIF